MLDMICSVMMMSLPEDGLVFELGLEVIPLGAVPDLVGVPALDIEGMVELAGVGVSPPVAEVSTDIGERRMGRNQLREDSIV